MKISANIDNRPESVGRGGIEMRIENKLKLLFDYQAFDKNPRLEKIIHTTVGTVTQLSDDILENVNAAGTETLLCADNNHGNGGGVYIQKHQF